ncbi:Periplasmic alpha-amylase [Klebsiella pneumoniae]|uniref:Periplasmic alpha-amylase n=1 Tax=Klebsiella pneumoniae TaxID=573 RepID=A0A377XJV8_KLEPN|nr:Periplasmic alpha-amylase [Klebsiella pneumoniae]
MMISLEEKETSAAAPQIRQCPKWDGKPLTIDVSKTFAEGSKVRDFYSGNVATVSGGKNHPAARLRQQWDCCCLSAPRRPPRRRF